VALSRRPKYVVLTLAVIAATVACYAATAALAADTKAPPASTVIKDLKPGQVGLVAYYPLNEDHKYIADYLVALAKKPEFKGKIKVEINDMQSSEGRDKWKTTGLGCAGVFINGKTHWEVIREGKKETVDFIKRMGPFWDKADFEAVVKQQIADPKKLAVVPPAKKTPAAKGESKGKGK